MLLACPHCHAKNRILDERFNDDPSCGRCGKPLTRGVPIALDEASFDVVIATSFKPVVVDFWAAWCGPCRGFAPVYAAASARHPDFVFAKVDTDANPNLSTRLSIRSIPTLMVFRNGQIGDRLSGALPAAQFDQWLQQATVV